jgi:hypothetical protein
MLGCGRRVGFLCAWPGSGCAANGVGEDMAPRLLISLMARLCGCV